MCEKASIHSFSTGHQHVDFLTPSIMSSGSMESTVFEGPSTVKSANDEVKTGRSGHLFIGFSCLSCMQETYDHTPLIYRFASDNTIHGVTNLAWILLHKWTLLSAR